MACHQCGLEMRDWEDYWRCKDCSVAYCISCVKENLHKCPYCYTELEGEEL